jgi:hypothetical protein
MTTAAKAQGSNTDWLKTYYYLRFAVSAAWVALAFTVGKSTPPLAAIMLVAYPAWDAIANYLDASRSGGLGQNKSQMLNFVVSIVTAVAVVRRSDTACMTSSRFSASGRRCPACSS